MKTINPIPLKSPDLTKIPKKLHYAVRSEYFAGGGRIHSYAHQIKTVVEQSPSRVLEVGKGPGMVAAALKAVGIEVITLDMQADLEPDLIGSVTQIPSQEQTFDVSLCCQVLEHLPFSEFVPALAELRRVTSKALVMSLPDICPYYYIKLKLPKIQNFVLEFSRPRFRLPIIPQLAFEKAGHFWEIGYKGSSLRDVNRSILQSGWKIGKTWKVPELPWHRFFLLIH